MFDTTTILYILIGLFLLLLVQTIVRLSKVKAWIKIKTKKGIMTEVGYLEYNNGEASEIFVAGGSRVPIGRVIIGESRDENGYVEILLSGYDESSIKPLYRPCGYISPDGYIYKKLGKNKRPERIGYTARPSNPNAPTSIGERTWKTLWLKCTLYAYLGSPVIVEETIPETTEKKTEKIAGIGNDVADTSEDLGKDLLAQGDESTQTEPEGEVSTEPTKDEAITELPQEENESDDFVTEKTDTSEEFKEKEKEQETIVPVPEESGQKQKKGKSQTEKNVNKPYAICSHWGFHLSKKDFLSPESRACAFALFFNKYNKNNYSEYYKEKPYGWSDTALLSSFVYSLIYLLCYVLITYVWKKTFVGDNDILVYEFVAFYFLLWAMVRQLKIYSIESLDTIQPKIDLFNKTLGHKWFDITIIILGLIALSFTSNYYQKLDWVPLTVAILVGVIVNMFCKSAHTPWVIRNTFIDNEEFDEDEYEEPTNPEGDIARSYDWDLDSNISENKLHGNLTLYFTAMTITDLRQLNPFYDQLKEKSDKEYIIEMFHYMKEHKSLLSRLRYVAYYIEKMCDQHSLHILDRIQFVLDFVQEPNIKFCMNRDSEAVNRYEDYIRFPDETLYDKEGDSNSKALLAAMLFHLMKHNIIYLHSRTQQHAAIGVEVKPHWLQKLGPKQMTDEMTLEFNGKRYIFCETTGDRFKVIEVMEGMKLEDFEERVELSVIEDDVDDTNISDTQETRMYNWDLDSETGNHLHGSFTLEFNKSDIIYLRERNPFGTYGEDSFTYVQNIHRIFDFMKQNSIYSENVKSIARYIKESVKNAGLAELDLVQFALDFAQAPNIKYCIDENSASINFAKEYMRFPDEVLYDKEGDCDCKSSLTAALFHELGYNVIVMLSQQLGHAAIGIELKEEWLDIIKPEDSERVVRDYNGKRYLYCETTGDGYKIGHIREADSIQDFETIVEIPA
jgi:hypothetical protein